MAAPINLSGKIFGRLKVIKRLPKQKWECVCSCGKIKAIRVDHLRRGETVSCGCIRMGMSKTHGETGTRFYACWSQMKRRCKNPKATYYEHYGGRGISFDPRWEKYEEFTKDMRKAYDRHVKKHGTKQTTLDRINVDKNYCKENCRWATMKEQQNNKRNTRWMVVEGEKMAIQYAAKKYNINKMTLHHRLDRGWPDEKAIKRIKD